MCQWTQHFQVHPNIENTAFWSHFNDCIGAIDGTHIKVVVAKSKRIPYLNMHNETSQNVLVVCDFDMRFTFVLSSGLVQHMTWKYSKISWLLIITNFHIHHQVRLWNYLTRMCLNLTSSSKRHDMRDLLMQGSFTWLMRDTQTGRATCHHTNVQGTMWSNGKTAPPTTSYERNL